MAKKVSIKKTSAKNEPKVVLVQKKVLEKKSAVPVHKMIKKDYNALALALHKKLKGKIEIRSKGKLTTRGVRCIPLELVQCRSI